MLHCARDNVTISLYTHLHKNPLINANYALNSKTVQWLIC